MPREFTLGALQRAHEAILGRPLDPRNFRKRVLESDLRRAHGRDRSAAARTDPRASIASSTEKP